MATFTFNERPVHNPLAKAGIVLALMVGMVLLLCVGLPLALLTHPLFRLFGLQGNIRHEAGDKFSIVLDKASFKRV